MEKQLTILSNGMEGEGIAKEDGKVIFVPFAVEGDNVVAEIIKENKNFSIAKLKEIKQTSQFRCNPKCKYFGDCGGCDMQHISYEKQLEIKTQNVKNLLDKQKLNFEIFQCEKSNLEYGYRNKLTVYLSNNNSLGFHRKKSTEIISISSCQLVDEQFNALIFKLNNFFKNNLQFNRFLLKGMTIRRVQDVFLINLILTKKINLDLLEKFFKLNKIKYSLFYCINSKNSLPTYPTYFVGGVESVALDEFNIKYNIHPMSFMQVNTNIKQKLYQKVLESIKPNNVVLDAYSGMGLLSCMIAKISKRVFAIEIDESASKTCEQICVNNKITNVQSVLGDCAIKVPEIMKTNKIDVVVLDPARKGVDENSLKAIQNARPKKIIYISCNPATLARDLKILTGEDKYKIKLVQPFDMFPQTKDVETLAVLELE